MVLEQMKVFKKNKRDGFGNELLAENQRRLKIKNQNHEKNTHWTSSQSGPIVPYSSARPHGHNLQQSQRAVFMSAHLQITDGEIDN